MSTQKRGHNKVATLTRDLPRIRRLLELLCVADDETRRTPAWRVGQYSCCSDDVTEIHALDRGSHSLDFPLLGVKIRQKLGGDVFRVSISSTWRRSGRSCGPRGCSCRTTGRGDRSRRPRSRPRRRGFFVLVWTCSSAAGASGRHDFCETRLY